MLNLYTAPPKERLRRENPVIETPRLLLRPWRPSDLPIFAEQNADPEVIQFLGGVLNREESDAYVARADRHLADLGSVSGRSKRRASHRSSALSG